MKRVNHNVKSASVYSVLIWLYEFRTKFNFTDASLYDIIFVYWYYYQNGKGVTLSTLLNKRYGRQTGYIALRARVDLLADRGLVYRIKRNIYPSELLLKEMASLELPEVLIKCILETSKKAA